MTFKEKLAEEHPDFVGDEFRGGAQGCPCHFGYERYDHRPCAGKIIDCGDCWNREMPEEKPAITFAKSDSGIAYSKIQDSGERQEFATGAVRDIQKGKGRCDLMPLEVVCKYLQKPIFGHLSMFLQDCDTGHLYECLSLFSSYYGDFTDTVTDCTMFLEVAKHFEEGAEKYGENNWQKGLPVKCYINSAVRHYLKWLRDDKDERHDRAFVWNLMCCIWEVDYSPRAKTPEPAMEDILQKHVVGEVEADVITPCGDSVVYLCDRKACSDCSYPDCKHTSSIEHAVNFEMETAGVFGRIFIEKGESDE